MATVTQATIIAIPIYWTNLLIGVTSPHSVLYSEAKVV